MERDDMNSHSMQASSLNPGATRHRVRGNAAPSDVRGRDVSLPRATGGRIPPGVRPANLNAIRAARCLLMRTITLLE